MNSGLNDPKAPEGKFRISDKAGVGRHLKIILLISILTGKVNYSIPYFIFDDAQSRAG